MVFQIVVVMTCLAQIQNRPGTREPSDGKRKGGKATKKNERLLSKGHVLEPDEATAFRARSAHGNYLEADRPDIGYSAKDMCR